MDLDFFEKLNITIKNVLGIENTKKEIKQRGINVEEVELAEKLDAIEEFTIDRIEEDMVVLEDNKNRKMINIQKKELPYDIKEGNIIKKINGKYFIDENETLKREEEILERFKKLRGE